MVDTCYTDAATAGTEVHSDAGEKTFRAKYKAACVGKENCEIKLDLNTIKPNCKKIIDERVYTSSFATAA